MVGIVVRREEGKGGYGLEEGDRQSIGITHRFMRVVRLCMPCVLLVVTILTEDKGKSDGSDADYWERVIGQEGGTQLYS